MKEFIITKSDEGRRFDKYVMGVLSNAPSSFTYKMIRKKNIVLNDTKASGSEMLRAGDHVRFYLSDDTFDRFSKRKTAQTDLTALMPPVIYEDEDIMIVNKPAGMLTQKSSAEDISLNEICLSHSTIKNENDPNGRSFTPSVCNRLDRNTSGLVTFAKTYRGAKYLSCAFHDRTVGKFYKCIVSGIIEKDFELTGSLIKDEKTNTVRVMTDEDAGMKIVTRIHPLKTTDDLSLLEIELITGKTHQIRAHLASLGHPIIGDGKYGDNKTNSIYRKAYGIKNQMLVCYRMVFPDDQTLGNISGKVITIDAPDDFYKVMNGNMEFTGSSGFNA